MRRIDRNRSLALVAGVGALLFVLNWFTQPFEDAISAFPRGGAFYADAVWYLDDIIGPALFMAAGIVLLLQVPARLLRAWWPVVLLGVLYIVFALGDTVDAHWVVTEAEHAGAQAKSFGSFGSKIMSVLTLGYAMIYAWRFLTPRAARALLFAYLLIVVDQVHLAVSFEFAGYSFHVFEESVEVVAGLFLLYGVTGTALREAGDPA